MQLSKLRFYSIGIVAANKELKSKDVEVVPLEEMHFADGELSDNTTKYDASGTDAMGASYQHSIDTTASVKATWLPIGTTNRSTAPDVRRGERVVLYQFADQDKFWWTTLFYDSQLRKLETVIYTFSGTRQEDVEPSADNQYFMEISTHKKLVTFHTSKADGEPFTYDMQLNTGTGSFLLTDDIGNFFSLDSTNVRLEMKNADGSHLDMDRKNITMTAPDSIHLEAGNNVTVKAGSNILSEAGATISDKASTIVTKANQTTNTVPITTFTGKVIIQGGMAVSGGSGGATATVAGSMTVTGGEVTVDGIGVKGHHHIEQGDGQATSNSKP